MAGREVTVHVQLEFTPTGRALLRLAQVIGMADPMLLPDEVRAATLDVLAITEEHQP